jgi:hypothetical protein
MRRLPLLLALALAALHASCLQGPLVVAASSGDVVATWDRFDAVGFLWPPPANPFDPAEADLRGEFRAPDGQVTTLPAFYTRDFTRALVGGFEHLTPYGVPHWRTRFTPTRPGAWEWRWVATTPGGRFETAWRAFTVTPAAPGRHGFLRTSPDDPRFLRFDDGAPYLALGLNLCWYDGRGSFAYDDWFAKLAAQGATYVRLWMPSWAFGLEWIRRDASGALASSSLGDYRERLDRAWQLDHVLESAARHGLQVMLSLQNHGAFSLSANSEWADSPYNATNGGPLAEPREFFTDPAARELFRRRLRYVVARWGYATNLLAFELWNEVDLAESPGVQPVRDWHVEMAGVLRALDPYDHLVTTSTTIAGDLGLFALPEIDFAQLHFYAYPGVSDLSESIPFLLTAIAAPGKPVLAAEIGVDYRGPVETIARDPTGVGVHDTLWAGVLAGSLGTGMSWWWDNVIDPLDLWSHWGPVARATEGIAFDREAFAPGGAVAQSATRPLRAYALRGTSTLLAWVRNTRHQWYPPGTGLDPTPIADATLAVSGLADGDWQARWIDTLSGADLAVGPVQIAGGAATLPIPTFSQDVALRLERR